MEKLEKRYGESIQIRKYFEVVGENMELNKKIDKVEEDVLRREKEAREKLETRKKKLNS